MRDSARETLATFWTFAITTTGCILTEAKGVAWLAPLMTFIYFVRAYVVWCDDDGDEITDFIEDVKKMFRENPPIDIEKTKKPISEEEMADFYRRKRRRRRRLRR